MVNRSPKRHASEPDRDSQSDLEDLRTGALAHLRDQHGLTRQEARVAIFIGEGLTVTEAAADLGIALSTARWHLKNAYSKLDINRQNQLVRLALAAKRGNPSFGDDSGAAGPARGSDR